MAKSFQLYLADGVSKRDVDALLRELGAPEGEGFTIGTTFVEVSETDADRRRELLAEDIAAAVEVELRVPSQTYELLDAATDEVAGITRVVLDHTTTDAVLVWEYDLDLLRRTGGKVEVLADPDDEGWRVFHDTMKQQPA